MYTDQRTHISGPPRFVRQARVGTLPGLAAISKAPEEAGRGRVAVVAGREYMSMVWLFGLVANGVNGPTALQIICASSLFQPQPQQPTRSSIADTSIPPSLPDINHSRAGYRLDASRNLWHGSGLKVDSALTDVGWGVGGSFVPTASLSPLDFWPHSTYIAFSNKILTGSRKWRTRQCRIYIIQSLSVNVLFPYFPFPSFLSLFVRSHPWYFTPPLSSFHAHNIHMRTAMNISQSRSSFSVDISSIYHPPLCLLSFHKILKLTSKIHPHTERRAKDHIRSIH